MVSLSITLSEIISQSQNWLFSAHHSLELSALLSSFYYLYANDESCSTNSRISTNDLRESNVCALNIMSCATKVDFCNRAPYNLALTIFLIYKSIAHIPCPLVLDALKLICYNRSDWFLQDSECQRFVKSYPREVSYLNHFPADVQYILSPLR